MRRTEQQENGALGEEIAAKQLLKLGFLPTKTAHDFGIDFVAQVTRKHEVTSNWILVQVKAKRFKKKRSKGQGMYVSVSTKHIKHWKNSSIPVVIIAVDVGQEVCYWRDASKLELKENRKDLRVHFKKSDKLTQKHTSNLVEIACPSHYAEELKQRQKRRGLSEHWEILVQELPQGEFHILNPKHDQADKVSPQITTVVFEKGSSAEEKFDKMDKTGEPVVLTKDEFLRIEHSEIAKLYELPEATFVMIRQLPVAIGKFSIIAHNENGTSQFTVKLIREKSGSQKVTLKTPEDSTFGLTIEFLIFPEHVQCKVTFSMKLGHASVSDLLETWCHWQKVVVSTRLSVVDKETDSILVETKPGFEFPPSNLHSISETITALKILRKVQQQVGQTIRLSEELTEDGLADLARNYEHLLYDGIGFKPDLKFSATVSSRELEQWGKLASGNYAFLSVTTYSLNIFGTHFELGNTYRYLFGIKEFKLDDNTTTPSNPNEMLDEPVKSVSFRSKLGVVLISPDFCKSLPSEEHNELEKIGLNVIRFFQGAEALKYDVFDFGNGKLRSAQTSAGKE